jgi:integrase
MMSDAPRRPRSRKVAEGQFSAVIRAFQKSPKWEAYSEGTRGLWARELSLAEHILGHKSIDELRPSLLQAFFDGLADRPGKAATAYHAIKQLEKWAIVRDLLPHHILTGVEHENPEGGHKPWSEDHVDLAERYARPDLAKAVTLAANTGQRGSDLIKMRENNIEQVAGRLGINVTQKKTGRVLWIPFTEPLLAAYTTWERRPGFLLRDPNDGLWTRKRLTEAWTWHRDHNPALAPLKEAGLVLHGLRATACVRLYHAGATALQIAWMVGMTVKTVERYLRFSIQKENALAAVLYLDAHKPGANQLKNKALANQEH